MDLYCMDVVDQLLNRIVTELEGKRDISGMESTKCKPGPNFCISEVLESLQDSSAVPLMLNSLSVKVASTILQTTQIHCVKQQSSGYCGHYALFFAITCEEICRSKTVNDLKFFLGQLSMGDVAFWKRYWQSMHQLQTNIFLMGNEWPWTKRHITAGDMERSFLTYLLDKDTYIKAREINVLVLHYAYGLLQDSCNHITHIQECIDTFRCTRDSTRLVFIIGVTNHWVALLAYKTSCNLYKMGLLYLDSNNDVVLGASTEHLEILVAKRERKRQEKKGTKYTAWERKILLQSFKDQRDIVHLLGECLVGRANLCQEHVTRTWEALLDSYNEEVINPLKDEFIGSDFHTGLVLQWLEVHYQPTVIINNQFSILETLGLHNVKGNVKKRLLEWLDSCRSALHGINDSSTNLYSFKLHLQQFDTVFKF